MLYTDEQARNLIRQTRADYPVSSSTMGGRMSQLMAALSERLPKKTKTMRRISYVSKDGTQGEHTMSEAGIAGYVKAAVDRGDTYISINAAFTVTDDE